jgi:hypothetical protein
MDDTFITITNHGATITSTTYWGSSLEKKGLFYLTSNAGTLRLLMPRSEESLLREMQTAREIVLTCGRYKNKDNTVELLFDDTSDSPFCLWLDPAQVDRVWTELDESAPRPLVVYTYPGKVVWQTTCHLRHEWLLPHMQPWQEKA